jgi:hypothetical protein
MCIRYLLNTNQKHHHLSQLDLYENYHSPATFSVNLIEGPLTNNAEVANSCHKINFMSYLELTISLPVACYVANNDPFTVYKWHQNTKKQILSTQSCTLFIAWPMWGFPLAKGGPSCRTNSGPWTCFLCQLYKVENSHFWKENIENVLGCYTAKKHTNR